MYKVGKQALLMRDQVEQHVRVIAVSLARVTVTSYGVELVFTERADRRFRLDGDDSVTLKEIPDVDPG